MEPDWPGAHCERDSRLWSAVLRPAAAELGDCAADVSDVVTRKMVERLPDLLHTAEGLEANRASTEASIRDLAEVMRRGSDPEGTVVLRPATMAYALDGAQHAVPLTTLMRSYRLAHASIFAHLTKIVARHVTAADDLAPATELCSAWMFAYVDAALVLVEEVYTSERERWLRSAAASQAETIGTILSGEPIDVDIAARRLRHDMHRIHIAAIGWLDTHEEGRDTLALLEAAVRDIAAAIGTQKTLVHPVGTLSVAAWVSSKSTVPSKVLDDLRIQSAKAPGVRVAIGEPASGITGFRTSHLQALEAQRIARLAAHPPGSVTRYNDVSLRSLATADIDHARAFVQRELGPLAVGDDTTRRLAATVRTYLEENGSRGRTARRLSIHENTVAYRLRQAEELLGRSLDKRTLELRVALALNNLVGESAQPGSR